MKRNNIKEIISKRDWDLLIASYSIEDICVTLGFREAMRLVNQLFYDNMQDDAIQQFALNLTVKIKNYFKQQWEEDWKNDVFLGHLYSVLWQYEDQYICYKRAYDKLVDPPEALLLLLAGCDDASLVPVEVLESYLERAINKQLTYEAALMMRALYRCKVDHKMEEYWDKMCKEIEQKKMHTQTIMVV